MEDFFDLTQKDRKLEQIVNAISSMPSNYVGSKRRLLRYIWNVLEEDGIKFDSVFDAFSGSAMVSLLFKNMGKTVIANDLLTSSAITAISLLENNDLPLTNEEIVSLCSNIPSDAGTFVADNYKDKFFTEKECIFLDNYRRNVEIFYGNKFYCGLDLLNRATLASVPNSNFSVYGDIKAIRSVHDPDKPFWKEKWRDSTSKNRDKNGEIMFPFSIADIASKYKIAFSLFAMENHINQNCFIGGRYYNGQTLAKIDHRLKHQKSNGKELTDFEMSINDFKKILIPGKSCVFNSDIIELLKSNIISTDLLYVDPPYGGGSSDYANLYSFLEEYIYQEKIANLEHMNVGGKRFSKSNGYQEQFELLLSLCKAFPVWLISYNESSYADIDTIIATIKNAGKTNIKVKPVPITYQYRKGKNLVDIDHFTDNYCDSGHKFTKRGTEYLILAG